MTSTVDAEIDNLHQLIRHTVSQCFQRANEKNDGAGLEARIRNLDMAAKILATPAGAAATTKTKS